MAAIPSSRASDPSAEQLLDFQTVMKDLHSISTLRPNQHLAMKLRGHSFTCIDRSEQIPSSISTDERKLLDRLDDIQVLINEVLSNCLLPREDFEDLTILTYCALEAIKLNNEHSPLLDKIISIKKTIFPDLLQLLQSSTPPPRSASAAPRLESGEPDHGCNLAFSTAKHTLPVHPAVSVRQDQ